MYIQLYSIHGLIRSKHLQLGINSDTGGQTNYVFELARSLGELEVVDQVDIITRQIFDEKIEGYDYAFEEISHKVKIVRLACGPRKYLRKEELWPYLDEFFHNAKAYSLASKKLPNIIHCHYADAACVGAKLSAHFNIPLVFTAHSLGEQKLKKLGLDKSRLKKQFDDYKFHIRIAAEQSMIDSANAIVVSSQHEKNEQYKDYMLPKEDIFSLIKPGIHLDTMVDQQSCQRGIPTDKPIILCLARLVKIKNHISLLDAFLGDSFLSSATRLVIASHALKNPDQMSEEESNVYNQLNEKILTAHANDKVCLTYEGCDKRETLYQCAKATGGVFVDIAFTEPFGLTLLEAGSIGLPVVATSNGGPRESVKQCRCGLLVNPEDTQAVAAAIKQLICDPSLWQHYSSEGQCNIPKVYSWRQAAKQHMALYRSLR